MSPRPILFKMTECQIPVVHLIRKSLEYVEVDISVDGAGKEMGQIMWSRDSTPHPHFLLFEELPWIV
jgi:hypothetical protein